LDRRIGCILGKANSDSKMYALTRNQISAMIFDEAKNRWMLILDSDLPNKSEFSFKDLTGTKSIGPLASPEAGHEDEHTQNNQLWQGIITVGNNFLELFLQQLYLSARYFYK